MTGGKKTPRRGKAAPDRQLSKLQRRVLLCLLDGAGVSRGLADELLEHFSPKPHRARKVLRQALAVTHQKGIPWSAKHFYNDAPTKAQEAALSKALHRLEAKGLVSLYDAAGGVGRKPRTTHVKLTSPGERTAAYLADHNGMSEREALQQQLKDERRAKLDRLYADMDNFFRKLQERMEQPVTPLNTLDTLDEYDMYDRYSDESITYYDDLNYEIIETAEKLGEAPILRAYDDG